MYSDGRRRTAGFEIQPRKTKALCERSTAFRRRVRAGYDWAFGLMDVREPLLHTSNLAVLGAYSANMSTTEFAQQHLLEGNPLSDLLREGKVHLFENLENYANGICFVDSDYRLVFQNAKHRKRFGDARGQQCHKVFLNFDEPCPGCLMAQAMEDGASFEHDYDTSDASYHVVWSALRNHENEVVGGMELVVDGTPTRDLLDELSDARRDLQRQISRVDRDLQLAQTAHQSLLPDSFEDEHMHVEVVYEPLSGIGGDYVHVHKQSPQTVHIIMCDISGHGIASALMVNRLHTEVMHLAELRLDPSEILDHINRFMIANFRKAGMFFTYAACLVELRKSILTFSGAAHPPVYVWRNREQRLLTLESQHTIGGAFENLLVEEPDEVVRFRPGDRLILYTDGLVEVMDADRTPLGPERFEEILRELMPLPVKEFAQAVMQRVESYRGTEKQDDKSLIVMEGKSSRP